MKQFFIKYYLTEVNNGDLFKILLSYLTHLKFKISWICVKMTKQIIHNMSHLQWA
jgi:hypothetical protein